MRINAAALAGTTVRPEPTSVEKVDRARQSTPDPPEDKRIQTEAILNKIKGLTQNGTYSIRFELNKEVDKLIINLVDTESGDLIRQIPSEELINASIKLQDYRGIIIASES